MDILRRPITKIQTGPFTMNVRVSVSTRKVTTVINSRNFIVLTTSLRKPLTAIKAITLASSNINVAFIEQRYVLADFMTVWLLSLPDGPAWNKDPTSILTITSQPKIQALVDANNTAINMIVDAFPTDTVFALPSWENSLGLPDPCAGPNPTILQRQTQVLARFIDNGGQSISYYESYALSLGYQIQITTFRAPICGIDICGTAILLDPSWSFYWQVNAIPSAALNNVLACEITYRQRASTSVFFTYQLGVIGSTAVQSGSNISTAP